MILARFSTDPDLHEVHVGSQNAPRDYHNRSVALVYSAMFCATIANFYRALTKLASRFVAPRQNFRVPGNEPQNRTVLFEAEAKGSRPLRGAMQAPG